ncbi:MAG: chemotaxis protein CheB [Actinomycetota bacterium]|nr:chemotaxis protein CheB [Actinomycetota bacterium]
MASPESLRIVALVSSGGGLDAVSRVLKLLPPDFPAAVIVLQHHSPDHVSHLRDVLSQRTSLPVTDATDGELLTASAVFIAPSGHHLLVASGNRVALIPSGSYPPNRPSADLLLTSLALTAGSRTIAVVLSGGGTDGATGATAVHHLGGLVIAADAASSAEPEMPAASIARDHAVDHVMDVDKIAAVLTNLVAERH